MKIKTKKTMNLPQLIEWAWDKDVREEWFYSDSQAQKSSYGIEFDEDGDFISRVALNSDLLFTVEVEEEITEDTVIPTLIERRDFGNELTYSRYEYVRIKDIKGRSSTVFYIENDDLTMTLIWRDGKLVE